MAALPGELSRREEQGVLADRLFFGLEVGGQGECGLQ